MKNGLGKIAVDTMGGDLGPKEVIEGVKMALAESPALPGLILLGNKELIEPILRDVGLNNHKKLSLIHTSQVIQMDEKPIQSLKQKKDSSMIKALELLKEGQCQGMVSCGNTGSLMAGGTLKLRTLPGLERPALSSVIPTKDRHFILIDVGANPETNPRQMVHNAILGLNHSRVELGVKEPKVALLTIGTEEGKGTERIHETHRYLKEMDGLINYTGLVEGFQVFESKVDVIICDGFVGNILIKTCESLFKMLKSYVSEELAHNVVRKMGAVLSFGAYKTIKETFDPERYGGAPLLGLNGIVFKAHGSSSSLAVKYVIQSCAKMLNHDMNECIIGQVEKCNQIMDQVDVVLSSKKEKLKL